MEGGIIIPLKFVMITTFYPPYHVGGDAIHVYNLSNELAKLGHEIHIIHNIDSFYWQRKQKSGVQYPNHENIKIYSIKSPIGKLSPVISYIFGSPFPMTGDIFKIIDKIKPDVLHHHNIAGFGPHILRAKARKVIYTAHDHWLLCAKNDFIRYDGNTCNGKSNCFLCSFLSKKPPQLWRKSSILADAFKNIDIITPSNYMKERLKKQVVANRIITIPNYVPNPPKTEIIHSKIPYLLFVGVLERNKGILNLIESFSSIKNEIDCKLVIVGSGSLENKIKKIVSEKSLSHNIEVLGRIDDIKKLSNLYANSLAVVLPSLCLDNCPLVALEALANGTPIIVTNKGGMPEIVECSKAGFVIDNVNSDYFSYSLSELIKIIKREDFRQKAFDAFSNNYNKENYIKKYLDFVGIE